MNNVSTATTPTVNYEELRKEHSKLTPGERRKRGLEGRNFDGRCLSKYFPEEADAAYMPGNDR